MDGVGKFGFTRDGGVWDGFAVGLEQKYIQNVDLGEIYILEGPKKHTTKT